MRLRKREKTGRTTADEHLESGPAEATLRRPGGAPHTDAPDGPAPGAAPLPEAAGELPATTLTQWYPEVALTGRSGASGMLRIELNRRRPPGGPGQDGVQLDLCALFELADGSKGVVQPLGGAHGSLDRPPFLLLGGGPGDAGAGSGSEHLTVNLDHQADFRRVLVFTTLYEGAAGFAGLLDDVTLRSDQGVRIGFRLDDCAVESTVCALALLTRTGADLVLRRESRFLPPRAGISPQRIVDYAYGWGLDWAPGAR